MAKNLFFIAVLIGLALIFWLVPAMQEVSAGVAILMFGMISLEKGFKSFAEGPLKKILYKTTDKFYKSFLLGVVSTTVLQSSSLISVITISFLSAGLLSLYQGLGIIFGANLGSTSTAWLIAWLGLKLEIATIAMPMLVFGVIFYLRGSQSAKGIGNILLGLGFFFLGIGLMKNGFNGVQGDFDLSDLTNNSPWSHAVYLLAGIVVTVILHSSGAAMALILSALAGGQITYLDALTLTIGANIGTTVTAIVSAMASNVDGKRVAAAHLFFNVFTAIVVMSLLNPIGMLVNQLADFFGIIQNDYTLKVAIFNTLFNMLGIIILSPLARMLEFLLVKLIHSKDGFADKPEFLNEAALAYPQSALEVMQKETRHLSGLCFDAMAQGLGMKKFYSNGVKEKVVWTAREETREFLDEYYYKRIKSLYGEIIQFGIRAQKTHNEPKYIVAINNVMEACRYFIESLKDVKDIQTNVFQYVAGDNEIMKKEYSGIRTRIIRFAQIIMEYEADSIPSPNNQKSADQLLEKLNAKRHALSAYLGGLKSRDVLFNGALSNYIQDKTLSSQMVTSLINDYRISYSINKHLLKAAELLCLNPALLISEISAVDTPYTE